MKQAKVLTEKELKVVVNFINAHDRHALRNKTMLMMTYLTGMRIKEIVNIKTTDVVNQNGNVVDVILLKASQTKGTNTRRVFINAKAKSLIKAYLNTKSKATNTQFMFATQKGKQFNVNALVHLFKRLYAQVGIKGATSHSGRRSFITKLANSGINVRVIAELASHKSIQTTQRYIDTNETMLANAVDLV